MKIIAKRSDEIFIVKEKTTFYLINTVTKQVTKANPPDRPDMFLKFGYFESVEESEVDKGTLAQLTALLSKSKH